MDLGKINQYTFPHFPMSAFLMEEIAAARDLEIQWVFCHPTNVLDCEFRKKVKADPHNDGFFLSVFQRENGAGKVFCRA